MNADAAVIKIKHDVLYEVAKHAFEGDLEEARDHIPNDLIPGPSPQFRCCVYKEREIIRQRIRLAENKAPWKRWERSIPSIEARKLTGNI